MQQYIKHYHMVLRTVGPVFVGDGRSLDKKEYIFQKNKGMVLIPDLNKMYQGITKKGLERRFTEYLLSNAKNADGSNRWDLGRWFRENNIGSKDYEPWILYKLDCGDFLQEKGAIEIRTFQKDAFGKPYVPGTSMKGMLRTILLANELMNDDSYCKEVKRCIMSAIQNGRNRTFLLKREVNEIENEVLHTLDRVDARGKEVGKNHAVNDVLSGLIISDSKPISLERMTLCQKIDDNVEGERKSLNLLRESVKPGTDIHFDLTIDSTICPYTIEDIVDAVNCFNESYYNMYLYRFKGIEYPKTNTVWLGGGSGFFTKTILYALLGQNKGIDAAVEIFKKTLPAKVSQEHKHFKDKRIGISPHTLKVTKYQGKSYQMGQCILDIYE
ncbi:MAG: type III-A CRISPR-associated RAMP protein Csm5 [Oliverpabstia sp.]|nr:type III-A CRISPR-associated RAMP protein Csm5 [Lachnospiraceae bacterium]MDY5025832.1 type III-A CRISPR-associated RAMP protein Csm5 [Oliverpabstia sp.]